MTDKEQLLANLPLYAKNLRFLLKKGDVTISKLERDMGWGKNSVHNYVTGNSEPNYDRTIKIADYFSVSIDGLLRVDMAVEGVVNEPSAKYNTKVNQMNENGDNHAVFNHAKSERVGMEQRIKDLESIIELQKQTNAAKDELIAALKQNYTK